MNESIVFGSRVGKLLVKMDYLEPDKESQYLSISGQCLKKEELKQAYLINQVSFHLPLLVRQSQSFVLSLKKQHQVEEHIINAEPGKQFYLLDFVLPSLNKNDVLEIELKQVEPALEWYVGDIRLSNENGRKIDLISSKQGNSIYLLEESLLKENIKQPDSFAFYGRKVVSSSLKFRVDVDESFLALVQPNKLPGLEKNGPCFYQTSKPNNFSSFSANEFKYAQQLPVLNLIVEEEFLSGDKGIYSNIEAKGRSSEVPAEIEYLSKDGLRAQNVGLRFHGGVHRRKPNALRGFRIYARRTYGNGSIGMPGDIFRQSDQKVETLVLRSNQAYGHLEDDYRDPNRGYNPFNHILALEIGERIGALVPRSQLVDFRINNVKQDLYLALDHLSETLFKQSYKSTDFKVFNYKKENTPLVEELYFSVKREIRESYGEDAFDVFMKYYDVDNVINSIILSIYIADDDYCQGVDIIKLNEAGEVDKIETINWDLDHAFINFDRDQWRSSFNPYVAGGFRLIDGRTSNRVCHRQHTYRYLYRHSKTFRTLIRQRLDDLLQNQLSARELLPLLEKYIELDKIYFNSKHSDLFTSFNEYFSIRPNAIYERLEKLESQSK